MQNNKVYFPNLNGLRFIAATLVIVSHIEQIKFLYGLPGYWHKNDFIGIIGKLGVILFFVLSGFLITYLLLHEKKLTKKVAIKSFYIRRILRIWPLYYLIIILSLFILPNFEFFQLPTWTSEIVNNFELKVTMFIFFLPNLALVLFTPVAYAAQTWSIGVEEQFYLIWPLLIKLFKRTIHMLIGVIVFYLSISYGLVLIIKYSFNNEITITLKRFWDSFSIDCMAIGGLLAYFLFENKKGLLKIIFNKYLQIFVYIITILFVVKGIKFHYLHNEIYGVLFGIIILNLAANRKSFFSLENKILDYLGKISYGLYMYHPIAISIALKLLISVSLKGNIILYFTSIIFTILMASFSFEVFEKQFLKAKIKYSEIISGDNVEKP